MLNLQTMRMRNIKKKKKNRKKVGKQRQRATKTLA